MTGAFAYYWSLDGVCDMKTDEPLPYDLSDLVGENGPSQES
jgi:hypothetical protein